MLALTTFLFFLLLVFVWLDRPQASSCVNAADAPDCGRLEPRPSSAFTRLLQFDTEAALSSFSDIVSGSSELWVSFSGDFQVLHQSRAHCCAPRSLLPSHASVSTHPGVTAALASLTCSFSGSDASAPWLAGHFFELGETFLQLYLRHLADRPPSRRVLPLLRLLPPFSL